VQTKEKCNAIITIAENNGDNKELITQMYDQSEIKNSAIANK
jgi:hypothetical protein